MERQFNSIRTRQEAVLNWLRKHEPDLLCLQETKVEDEKFPMAAFRAAGYDSTVAGWKTSSVSITRKGAHTVGGITGSPLFAEISAFGSITSGDAACGGPLPRVRDRQGSPRRSEAVGSCAGDCSF